MSKDPEWNQNIADENPDICDDLFKIIEKDGKGELLIQGKSKLWEPID